MGRFKYKIFKWFAWNDTSKTFRVMFQDPSQASISFTSLHSPWPKRQLCKHLNFTAHKSFRGCSGLSHHALQNPKHGVSTLEIFLIYLCDRKTQHFILGSIKYELTKFRKPHLVSQFIFVSSCQCINLNLQNERSY